MRRITSALAAVALAVGLIVVPGAAATAVPAPAVAPMVDPPDFTPSNSKARAWLLNILGSLLGKVTPSPWRAEQLANAHRFNHGWETLNAQFGFNTANPSYMGAPDSYDDYVIRRMEMDKKGGFGNKRATAPAFAASKWAKVGAALAAPFAYEIGAAVGNGVVELFGYDSEGLVCGSATGAGQTALAFVSGVSCDNFNAFVDEYIENWDAIGEPSWTHSCNAAGACIKVLGVVFYNAPFPAWAECWEFSGPGSPDIVFWRTSDDPNGPGGATTLGRNNAAARNACDSAFPGLPVVRGTFSLPVNETVRYELQPNPVSTGEIRSPDPDPLRTLTCTITGTDSQTYSAVSEAYRESSGGVAAPVCPELPDGVSPVSMRIDEAGPQGASELYNQDVSPEYLAWWNDYPECRTGACKLDLITLENPSYPVSCFDVAETTCADWFTDPNRDTKYACHYGIHVVDLAECFVYSGVFQPERLAIGAPYSDPMTGNWSGAQNAPTPDRQALGQPVQDPENRACTGMQAEGFDPVAWVMRPIQCALEWAFVPRPAVVALAGAQVATSWENSGPGEVVAMVSGWEIDPVMSGCSRSFDFPNPLDPGAPIQIDAWNACPGTPMAPIAAISRTLVTLSVLVLVVVMIRRAVSGTVDYKGH